MEGTDRVDDTTEDTLDENGNVQPLRENLRGMEFSMGDHISGPLKAILLRADVENRILSALEAMGESDEEILIAEINGIPNEFGDDILAQRLVNHFKTGEWVRSHSKRLRQNGVVVADEHALNANGSINTRRLNGSLHALQEGNIPVRHLIVLIDTVITEHAEDGVRSNVKTFMKNVPLTPEMRTALNGEMGPSVFETLERLKSRFMDRLRNAVFFQN